MLIVAANAGIATYGSVTNLEETTWQDMIDVNLTGVWHTCKAAIPHLIATGNGGAIVITSSIAGLRGVPNAAHYVSAKHGLVGLMRSMAQEVAQYSIRVNTIHPTNVSTEMFHNPATYKLLAGETASIDEVLAAARRMHSLPISYIEPEDIANAVLFLASDEARFVTGITLPVDGGALLKV